MTELLQILWPAVLIFLILDLAIGFMVMVNLLLFLRYKNEKEEEAAKYLETQRMLQRYTVENRENLK